MHLIKIKILILFNEQYFHHINRDKINLFLKQICLLLSADNIYIYLHKHLQRNTFTFANIYLKVRSLDGIITNFLQLSTNDFELKAHFILPIQTPIIVNFRFKGRGQLLQLFQILSHFRDNSQQGSCFGGISQPFLLNTSISRYKIHMDSDLITFFYFEGRPNSALTLPHSFYRVSPSACVTMPFSASISQRDLTSSNTID